MARRRWPGTPGSCRRRCAHRLLARERRPWIVKDLLPGDPSGAGWESAREIRAAALFDALIGQQDRNSSNFNYDSATDALGLFDNSFAFAIPGHQASSSEILRHVHAHNPTLNRSQKQALDRFQGSDEIELLEQILESARYQRLMERAEETPRRPAAVRHRDTDVA